VKTKYLNYRQVQLTANSNLDSSDILLILKSWFNTVAKTLIRFIQPSDEPRVWEHQNRNGTVYWCVYDPTSGFKACLGSELEVRFWLEQHFSRSPH
jgi:hypothetical protein